MNPSVCLANVVLSWLRLKAIRVLAVEIALLMAGLAKTQSVTVLYDFKGTPDGAGPRGALIMDSAGSVYGTTQRGGAFGYGAVFKIDASGSETVLYSFAGSPDGAYPQGGVVMDAAGNLYGTTYQGGLANNGTVFKLDKSGNETVLHHFSGPYDGGNPSAGLIMDTTGNLYGTAATTGGLSYNGSPGVVFRVDPFGQEVLLHSFAGSPDGWNPEGRLIMDAAGNLYGTTSQGGLSNQGIVFKLGIYGNETVLYSFAGTPDGGFPEGGLIMDASGTLYGSTQIGGASGYAGTVFKLDTSGRETVLYSFSGSPDGLSPTGDLIRDTAGNLYGTTFKGGPSNGGTLFKIDPSKNETLLYTFTGSTYTGPLYVGLVMDKAGNLYGSTTGAGAFNQGTIFKFSPGLPFSCISAKLHIDEHSDAFDLRASFSLGEGGHIDPTNEPVSITVGSYSVTIPMGSFVKQEDGYRFAGTIDSTRLNVFISPQHCQDEDAGQDDQRKKCNCDGESYRLIAKANGVNLEAATTPVAVSITIGDNTGSAKISDLGGDTDQSE